MDPTYFPFGWSRFRNGAGRAVNRANDISSFNLRKALLLGILRSQFSHRGPAAFGAGSI